MRVIIGFISTSVIYEVLQHALCLTGFAACKLSQSLLTRLCLLLGLMHEREPVRIGWDNRWECTVLLADFGQV